VVAAQRGRQPRIMKMVPEPMSIIEEIASQTIRAGGDAVEVEYKDGYEEVFPVAGRFGTSVGFRLDSSSQEAKSLREELYKIAKKRRRLTVSGREYELRCRIYDSFGEHAFRLEWKPVKPASTVRRRKTRS
jgi:hypothetical protein